MGEASTQLTVYDKACALVAEAKTIDEARDVMDRANAVRIYAKQAKNRTLELDALEIRLRAERRMGQIITQQKEGVGLDPGGRPSKSNLDEPDEDEDSQRAFGTLSDLGISRDLSSRSQKMALLDEDSFEDYLAEVRDDGLAGVQRATARLLKRVGGDGGLAANPDPEGRAAASLDELIQAGTKFATISMDPPWSFKTYSDKGKDRSPEQHYPTMSYDELAALPIPELMAENGVLHLWTSWPLLAQAFNLLSHWGLHYSTCGLLWIKTKRDGSEGLFTGMGYWSRSNSEFTLLATRGHPVRLGKDVHQVIIAPVMEHSRKPEEAASRMERLSPGPYLEMFARRTRPGWTVWGNEIESGVDTGDEDDA